MASTYSRYTDSYVQRKTMLITTVDPATRTVQGIGSSGDLLAATITAVSPAFRWPNVNEKWNIENIGGTWELVGKLQDPSEDEFLIEGGDPGDTIINGNVLINGMDIPRVYRATLGDGLATVIPVFHGLDTIGVICQLTTSPISTITTQPLGVADSYVFVDDTSLFSNTGTIYINGEQILYGEKGSTYFTDLTRGTDFDSWDEAQSVYQSVPTVDFTHRVVNSDMIEVSTGSTIWPNGSLTLTVIG